MRLRRAGRVGPVGGGGGTRYGGHSSGAGRLDVGVNESMIKALVARRAARADFVGATQDEVGFAVQRILMVIKGSKEAL